MENPAFYAILPADVRYDAELTPLEKILYAEISALTNKSGYCWAGNKYFAQLYGRHEKSISRSISKLGKKGFLKIEMQKGGENMGSERLISLPKKFLIPPHPTPQKCGVAKRNPLATPQKCGVDSFILNNIINIKSSLNTNCSALIDFYYKKFLKSYEEKPVISDKDVHLLKTKLKKHTLDELKSVIEYFFETKKSKEVGASLSIAISDHSINLYRSRPKEAKRWSEDDTLAKIRRAEAELESKG